MTHEHQMDPSAELQAERSLREREVAVTARERAVGVREEGLRSLDTATVPSRPGDDLNQQIREANEHLVVATVDALAAAESASAASRIKDDFLANVSHELRTPLNAVLGWTRMLMAKQLTAERADHAIQTIERNAVALARIIDDLLDVSRIVAGKLPLTMQPVDMVVVAQSALDVVRPAAVDRGIALRLVTPAGGAAWVLGDVGRLHQVLWNLLVNAVKFTPAGGSVTVNVRLVPAGLEVAVVDTGRGISAAFLPHVFERFRQADQSSSAPVRRITIWSSSIVTSTGRCPAQCSA